MDQNQSSTKINIFLEKNRKKLALEQNQINERLNDVNVLVEEVILEADAQKERVYQQYLKNIVAFIHEFFPGETEEKTPISERVLWQWNEEKWKQDTSISTYQKAIQGYLRIGTLPFLESIKQGLKIPYFVPFLNQNHLLFHSTNPKYADACIESSIYQILTTRHPMSVNITAIDCIGDGNQWSALSSLSAQFKGAKIYREPLEIEQALTSLCEQQSLIFQKYLSAKHKSIYDYQKEMGEQAESYHLICLSHFPANLSDESIKNIQLLASNGIRAGIHLLISCDQKIKLPALFELNALIPYFTQLYQIDHEYYRQIDPQYQIDRITLDAPPSSDLIKHIASRFNESPLCSSMTIDFEASIPNRLWQESTYGSIEADIGKTSIGNVLHLVLGKRVHHALIAAKPGMGKGVLLHNLICKTALRYPPNELELYLLDFKAGIEFKIYEQLPHMKAFALEAEREWAFALLDAIEQEVERRGQLFKKENIENNLKSYREKTGLNLPRIMVIINEFQCLFEVQDMASQQTKKKLDVLMKLGKSFGIHFIFTSQALADVNLEESTFAQIGLRIVFALNESDAIKALAKDNDLGKSLSKPGEGIFNDDCQMKASNQKFHVYLSKNNRWKDAVDQVMKLAEERELSAHPIVFKKDQILRYQDNIQLLNLFKANPISFENSVPICIGKAFQFSENHYEIKLNRQLGHHILMVGNHPSISISTCFAVILHVLLAMPKQKAKVKWVNHDQVTSHAYEYINRLSLEPSIEVVHPLQEEAIIQDFYQMLIERKGNLKNLKQYPTALLVIYGIHQSRSLNPDFNPHFNGSELQKEFQAILTEGPSVGIHILIWTQSYARLKNILSPQLLKNEFEYKLIYSNEAKPLIPAYPSIDLKPDLLYCYSASEEKAPVKLIPYTLVLEEKHNELEIWSKLIKAWFKTES